jgi:glutathione peroxidase
MSRTKTFATLALALGGFTLAAVSFAADPKPAKPVAGEVIKDPTGAPGKSSPLDFKVNTIDGKEVNLADLKGKVVMIVNVASRCGNTKQYAPLQAMYEKYKEQGLVIVGFPANEFGKQEPGTDEQIKEFCTSKYNVSFPMMSKIVVKGEGIHPLYAYLTQKETAGEFAGDIQWNFQKFLVDRQGNLYARIAPGTSPDNAKVVAAVEKGLAQKGPEQK